MNFRSGKQQADDVEINLVPLIDVLLVIIIFLMVAMSFTRFRELQIDLPSAQALDPQRNPQELLVGVSADGRYAIGSRVLASRDPESLADALRQSASGSDPILIINADAAASHQSVINVLEAARMAGLGRVTFATQAERTTQ